MGHLWLLSTVVSRLFACMAVCVVFSTQQKHVCISLYVPEYACLCVYEGVCVWVCVYQCSECARAHFLLLLQMESPADSSADQTCLDLKCILRCLVSLLREALLLQTELIAGTHRVCLPLCAPWGRSGEGGREGGSGDGMFVQEATFKSGRDSQGKILVKTQQKQNVVNLKVMRSTAKIGSSHIYLQ